MSIELPFKPKRPRVEVRRRNFVKSVQNPNALFDPVRPLDFQWQVAVKIPFLAAGSKNEMYLRGRARGGVRLNPEHASYRSALAYLLHRQMGTVKVCTNKLWVEIFVEKPTHRADAVNFVDMVCDAVKVATKLDDRWFCVSRVDWSINKIDPHLFVTIGQEDVGDVLVCGSCGQFREAGLFTKNSASRTGRSNYCIYCTNPD